MRPEPTAASPPARLLGGAYARKQLFCRDPLVAFSHRRRYRLARELVRPHAGGRLLDFGCGDGTFLALVRDLFPEAAGADIDPQQTRDCLNRFAAERGISFVLTEELCGPEHAGRYDVVVCMEVLEHCTEDKVGEVLLELRRLVSPTGVTVISVPIEVGPSLLVKQMARTVAGWRRIGDYEYRERYRPMELLRMVLGGESAEIPRPVLRADFSPDRPHVFHGHKGFNWRRLRRRLAGVFRHFRDPLLSRRGLRERPEHPGLVRVSSAVIG